MKWIRGGMNSNGEWGTWGGGVRSGVDLQEEWIGGVGY